MASSLPTHPAIPIDRVSQLVRQVVHDVRNGLSAVDLQAALLLEILEEGESRVEAMRLRDNIGNVARMLAKLSNEFQGLSLNPIACAAGPFLEDAKERLEKIHGERMRKVVWGGDVGNAWIEIDLEAILEVMGEVLKNAFDFSEGAGGIELAVEATPEEVCIRFHEEKSAEPGNLARWGREPFLNIRSGRYGLGLFRAQMIAKEHSGELRHSFDAANRRLTTILSIPVASAHG